MVEVSVPVADAGGLEDDLYAIKNLILNEGRIWSGGRFRIVLK
jgi:hypothetical protein